MNWEVRHGERRKPNKENTMNHNWQAGHEPDEIEALRSKVAFWQADSAAAWNKCEERRLEAVAMTQERNEFMGYAKDGTVIAAQLQTQLAAMTKERDELLGPNPVEQMLREQLAAMTQERDVAQQAYERCDSVCKATTECWNADLAAAQARIKELREVVAHHIKKRQLDDDHELCQALATPDDTTALQERLDQESLRVRRECIKDQQVLLTAERERCAIVADEFGVCSATAIRSMK